MPNATMDWSKAPSGATHFMPENCTWLTSWIKLVEKNYCLYWVEDTQCWFDDPEQEVFEWKDTFIPRRSEWDGTGVPPVGTICECGGTSGDSVWGVCEIKYVSGNVVVWKWEWQEADQECTAYTHAVSFRPVKSKTKDELVDELVVKALKGRIYASSETIDDLVSVLKGGLKSIYCTENQE